MVGATNRPQELDDAARRRLVKRLYIPLPDKEARVSILGYAGADMANLCREAAYGPIRSLDMSQIASARADQVRWVECRASGGLAIFLGVSAAPERILL